MSDSSNSESKDVDLRDAEILIRNKNVTSLWLLLITQLFYCFMYGFFMRVSSVSITSSEEFVHTALLLLLIIGGNILFISRLWTCFCLSCQDGLD